MIPSTIQYHYAPHNYKPWALNSHFIYTPLGLPHATLQALQSSLRNPKSKTETTVGGPAARKVFKSIRDVQALQLSSELITHISDLIHKSTELLIGLKLKPCGSFGFYQYESPSGHYDWHCDSGHVRNGVLQHNYPCRKVSIIYYPNTDYVGGELELAYSNSGNSDDRISLIKIKPAVDHLLIFPSDIRYPHRVLPVTSGTRFAIVNWFELVN